MGATWVGDSGAKLTKQVFWTTSLQGQEYHNGNDPWLYTANTIVRLLFDAS